MTGKWHLTNTGKLNYFPPSVGDAPDRRLECSFPEEKCSEALGQSAEILRPVNSTGMSLHIQQAAMLNTGTLLPNGKVLVVGGSPGGHCPGPRSFTIRAPARTSTWSTTRSSLPASSIRFSPTRADDSGLAFWTNEITSCGGDAVCGEVKHINVSAAFYLSIEFQETGYFVYRIHKAAHGNLPGVPAPSRWTTFWEKRAGGSGAIVGQRLGADSGV